jgi:hypothetical protein
MSWIGKAPESGLVLRRQLMVGEDGPDSGTCRRKEARCLLMAKMREMCRTVQRETQP